MKKYTIEAIERIRNAETLQKKVLMVAVAAGTLPLIYGFLLTAAVVLWVGRVLTGRTEWQKRAREERLAARASAKQRTGLRALLFAPVYAMFGIFTAIPHLLMGRRRKNKRERAQHQQVINELRKLQNQPERKNT